MKQPSVRSNGCGLNASDGKTEHKAGRIPLKTVSVLMLLNVHLFLEDLKAKLFVVKYALR